MGILQLDLGAEKEFSGDDEALLFQLCRMASIAIENTLFAEAREANRIKDEFLATLSHELRTPLTAMLGWVQLLGLSDSLSDETRHGLEIIERNVNVQTKLIDDLLDISRIVAGKLHLNVSRVDLVPILKSVVDDSRPAAVAKQITLSSDVESDQVLLLGDPDRLRQVFWNLLNNAVKFTPAGGRIEVLERETPHGVNIEVRDSGIGISSAFLPFVFERFRQADSTSTRSHSGLGIGLALVRHVVELHGGSVSAASPAKTGVPPSACPYRWRSATVQSNRRPPPTRFPVWRSMAARPICRACVCWSSTTSRTRGTCSAAPWSGWGARVATAASAVEAIRLIEQEVPDMLLSDIGMPEMDGYALIRYLREARARARRRTAGGGDHGLCARARQDQGPRGWVRGPREQADRVRHAAGDHCQPAAQPPGPGRLPARARRLRLAHFENKAATGARAAARPVATTGRGLMQRANRRLLHQLPAQRSAAADVAFGTVAEQARQIFGRKAAGRSNRTHVRLAEAARRLRCRRSQTANGETAASGLRSDPARNRPCPAPFRSCESLAP